MSDAPKDEHFDLFIIEREGRFHWSIPNRGVTVMQDRIAFSIDNVAHEGRFADIKEVRLTLQPIIAKGSRGTVGWCRIVFADGYALNVTSSEAQGFPSPEHTAAYIHFMSELHHRLPADDKQRIRFRAGVSEGRHLVLVLCAGFFALMSFVPLIAFFYSGEWSVLLTLIACVGFAYPLWKNAEANRPRSYNPDSLPDDLVPEA